MIMLTKTILLDIMKIMWMEEEGEKGLSLF